MQRRHWLAVFCTSTLLVATQGCSHRSAVVPICGAERGLEATIIDCSGPIALSVRVQIGHPGRRPVDFDRFLSQYKRIVNQFTSGEESFSGPGGDGDLRTLRSFALLSLDPLVLVAMQSAPPPPSGPGFGIHDGINFDVLQFLHILHNDHRPPCMQFDWPLGLQVLDSVSTDDVRFIVIDVNGVPVRHDDASMAISVLGERAQIRDGRLEVDLR